MEKAKPGKILFDSGTKTVEEIAKILGIGRATLPLYRPHHQHRGKRKHEMIKVKHPDEKYRKNQEEFLNSCPPEDRRFHALMFTYGNITYRYHQRSTEFNPSLQDYYEWLEGLPEDIRKDMRRLGFEKCKSAPSFTRYVMEKNDIGMEEYIRQHMDPEDYAAYNAMRKAL